MQFAIKSCVVMVALVLGSQVQAHVSVASGPVFAGKTNVVTLNVPHGCEGADTYRIEVSLPENFSSVRPMDGGAFWKASLVKDAVTNITLLIWTKDVNHILEADQNLYQVTFRSAVSDTPFVTAYFPTVQYCRNAEGVELTAAWTDVGGDHGNHGATAKPAPAATLYPPRYKGWNKYTVGEHVHNLDKTFADAEIVWAGSAAFSPNPNTQTLINNDASVTALDAIHPGTDIWVKY